MDGDSDIKVVKGVNDDLAATMVRAQLADEVVEAHVGHSRRFRRVKRQLDHVRQAALSKERRFAQRDLTASGAHTPLGTLTTTRSRDPCCWAITFTATAGGRAPSLP